MLWRTSWLDLRRILMAAGEEKAEGGGGLEAEDME
jgi:hypothetical protein